MAKNKPPEPPKPKSILDEFMELPDDDNRYDGTAGWWEVCEQTDPVRSAEIMALIDAWIADERQEGPRKKALTVEGFRKQIGKYIIALIGRVPKETTFRHFIARRKQTNAAK